jgi:hypothetical protein
MALVQNTNSYVTVAQADAYMENRIGNDNWTSATNTVKEQVLITATQLVDDNPWIGYAVSSSQALAWPRENAIYYDDRLGLQVTVPNDEVPTRVLTAVYEQALHLLDNDGVLKGQIQTFESISVGSISLSDSNSDVTRISIRPSTSTSHIRPLLRRGSTGGRTSWWRAN